MASADPADPSRFLAGLRLASFDGLVNERVPCPQCQRRQQHYCAHCTVVLPNNDVPHIRLPVTLDVIHHVCCLFLRADVRIADL
jgi:hypothetical protein